MRESFGGAFMIKLVLIFIVVYISFMAVAINYAKAFRVKNQVINMIEQWQYNGEDTVRDEIEAYLRSANYSSEANYTGGDGACPAMDGVAAINTLRNYRYCVYKHQTVKGDYYTVKAYQTYNFPLIGDIIKVRYSITGDTQVLLELQP